MNVIVDRFFANPKIHRFTASSSLDWYFLLTIDLVISVLNNLSIVLLVESFFAGNRLMYHLSL